MELEVRVSMEKSLKMKTLRQNTYKEDFYPWLMLDKILMEVNSLSYLKKHHGQMVYNIYKYILGKHVVFG